ncbi:hypothetical protein [Desulfovermiculus halophilus]|jgi:hypothetical protein|uniref:hypothetical protein n=1 Tax=Desulfovermiculus halophilus TaxID=339722 RepID=UPI000483D9BC|nr:hypothetical protein [Desulfovermiculus halophilus]
MAQFFPYFQSVSVTDQIKTLPNEELLDFWEETQYMDTYSQKDSEQLPFFSLEYERAVLQELQLRRCMGHLESR